MFRSPIRAALSFCVIGFSAGLIRTLRPGGEGNVLISLTCVLIGFVYGVVFLLRWQRNESHGRNSSIWLLVAGWGWIVTMVLGFLEASAYAMGGFGLASLIGLSLWEKRRQKSITWQDLNPKQEAES